MKILRSMAVWITAGGLVLGVANVGRGQSGSGTRGSSAPVPSPAGPDFPGTTPPGLTSPTADDPLRNRTAHMEQDQEKARNSDRQKKLISDTDRLLALANELKADVGRTNKDTLSLDVIRKADEIERLAHSVKEKMKGQ